MQHYEKLAELLIQSGMMKSNSIVKGCELGVRHGDTSKYLLNTFKDKLHLTLIDFFGPYNDGGYEFTQAEQDSICNKMLVKLSPFKQHFEFVKDLSTNAANKFPDGQFSFVFIDSNHDYTYVKADIEAWKSKIKPNGWLYLHDASMSGVKRAVHEFLQINDKDVYQTGVSTDIFAIKM